MKANADGTTVVTDEDNSPGATFRGFSVRCSCGALAFDWISTEGGGLVLRCSSCDGEILRGSDVEIGEEQLDRLERLEDRRDRI